MRLALALCLLPLPAAADFIETTWTITAIAGEWFVGDAADLIGQTQAFEGGWAEGAFYSCDFAGQTMGYTVWGVEDFLANPEFAAFDAVADDLRALDSPLYVHRITCLGVDAPDARAVMHPFVTNDSHAVAHYAFGGAVFTLEAE